MEQLDQIKLIQGGMGVYVSNWRLAKRVAVQQPGVTVGTVSGTALDVVYVRLLQLGDPGSHIRRALQAFDERFSVTIGRRIYEKYYIEGGKDPHDRFRTAPLQRIKTMAGKTNITSSPPSPTPIPLTLDDEIIELLIVTAFAEVWLAKEGHSGKIFINFLHKIELPLIYALYGAMLAGVDGIIVGAGNPEGLPAICQNLSRHEAISQDISVLYRASGEKFVIAFDPQQIAGGKLTHIPLSKPAFLAIVSLEGLVEMLAQSSSGAPDGFIIEHHTAGGHNANPLGPPRMDSSGQPLYGPRDEADLDAVRAVNIPFWLAGGYGSNEKLKEAISMGAKGVQVGTAFALAEESGLQAQYRQGILSALKEGVPDQDLVRTTTFSPTGFSFKVVQLQETLSDQTVYEDRRRICDIGMLQQQGLSKADENGERMLFQRCPAAPVDNFVNSRGLAHNTTERRCLCNGLLSCVGLGQVKKIQGEYVEEPAIVTLGNQLEGVRRLSRQGQRPYYVEDVVADILG